MKFVLPIVIVGISTTEISSHCIAWVTKESTLDMQQKYHMANYTGQIPNRAEFSRFSSYKTQHALWLSSGTLDISFITPICLEEISFIILRACFMASDDRLHFPDAGPNLDFPQATHANIGTIAPSSITWSVESITPSVRSQPLKVQLTPDWHQRLPASQRLLINHLYDLPPKFIKTHLCQH